MEPKYHGRPRLQETGRPRSTKTPPQRTRVGVVGPAKCMYVPIKTSIFAITIASSRGRV
jgi:hypothetical protein